MHKSGIVILSIVASLLFSSQGLAQSGRTLKHAVDGFEHSIWVPEGYEEVLWPETPRKQFRESLLASLKQMDVKSDDFAVLIRKKDLEAYNRGQAEHPMRGHYIFIKWYPNKSKPSKETTTKGVAAAQGSNFLESLKSLDDWRAFIDKYTQEGQMTPLGIMREWEGGYITGMAVRITLAMNGRPYKTAKILNMGFQSAGQGHYVINCVTLQVYGRELADYLDRTVLIAKSLKNSPAMPKGKR